MSPAPKIAALLLAAGSSRRFGSANKLLTEISGQPLVGRVADTLEAGGIDRLVVVTGHQADRIAAAVARTGRRITYNERHTQGLGTSIASGIKALDDDVDGVLIVQGDMPALSADAVAALCKAFAAAGGASVVHPITNDGRQGNPVLWPRRLFAVLCQLSGDEGAKTILIAEAASVVGVPGLGRGVGLDIDTPEQLAAYLADGTSQPR